VSKAYARFWSIFWGTLACSVLITALVVWSWVGVIATTAFALLLSSVILGSAPNQSSDPHTVFGGIAWRVVLAPALRWAVIAVAVVLTTVFSPWLGVLVLAAVVGSSPWALRRLCGSSSPVDDPGMEHIRLLVRQLDLPGLCWAWRASHDLLVRIQDTEARHRVVTLRQEYLDEMERRDAAGFQTWLEVARAAGDPEAFLRERPSEGDATAA
jgi:hypothetical protein